MAIARLMLGLALTGALFGGAALGTAPARAQSPAVQPSYEGDCDGLPAGAVCLEFADGYVWAVEDTVTGWGMNHGTVQMAYGLKANYAHALGTEIVWTLDK